MKVTDTKQIAQLQVVGPATSSRQPVTATPPETADRVSTEDTARLTAAMATASEGAGTARAAKLADIEQAVRQGTYRPDPQQIAEQILDDAELAARLQALFGR